MKASTFLLLLALAALGFAAAPKEPKWQGRYWNTEAVTISTLRQEPHASMQKTAEEFTRILAKVPRSADGYIVEWMPSDTCEGGHFCLTAWTDVVARGGDREL